MTVNYIWRQKYAAHVIWEFNYILKRGYKSRKRPASHPNAGDDQVKQ